MAAGTATLQQPRTRRTASRKRTTAARSRTNGVVAQNPLIVMEGILHQINGLPASQQKAAKAFLVNALSGGG